MTPNLSGNDLLTGIRTIYGEARGEPSEGKLAVAHVLLNRLSIARDWKVKKQQNHPLFGDGTLAGVCMAHRQFSAWNENDPNRAVLLDLTLPAALSLPDFRACAAALFTALDDPSVPDPSGRATHYHTVGADPAWDDGKQPSANIGHHVFYRDV